jgi:diguanylate cyclase (GGDEF)-like protein
MEGYRAHGWPAVKATMGLEDVPASAKQRFAALAMAAVLVLSTSVALLAGDVQGPELRAFIPIAVTSWSLADLLTAFLLLAQFFVSGRIMIALLAIGYAFSGLMSWAYIGAFPGVLLPAALPVASQQISVALWLIWHATFPLFVIAASLNDSNVGRIVSRRAVAYVTVSAVCLPIVAAGAVAVLLFACSGALPHFVEAGRFRPVFRAVAIPTIVFLNGLACCILLARRKRFTPLSLWLAVATLSEALDALLNLSAGRYTFAWDVGKVIAVVTACTVMFMMLIDVAALYGRLAKVARLDPLTGLANRRAFEERFELVMCGERRAIRGLAILVLDIDLFKNYNDTYGHAAGDDCLRRVAGVVASGARRTLDLAARYGGEEFVVLLPDSTLQGAREVAERLRAGVEALAFEHAGRAPSRITVSAGIAYAPDARAVQPEELFEAADRALYAAKSFGRNRVVLGSAGSTEPVASRQATPGSTVGRWDAQQSRHVRG